METTGRGRMASPEEGGEGREGREGKRAITTSVLQELAHYWGRRELRREQTLYSKAIILIW